MMDSKSPSGSKDPISMGNTMQVGRRPTQLGVKTMDVKCVEDELNSGLEIMLA